MISYLTIILVVLILSNEVTFSQNTGCGEWISYKNEKCFKIFSKEETKSFDNALKSCITLDDSSTLVVIDSKEEADFISNYVFVDNKIVDDIWIGARRFNSSSFKWLDNSEMRFSNWVESSPNRMHGNCAQMLSGLDFYSPESNRGIWADVSCDKKNLVVCQKLQVWSISELQKLLFRSNMLLMETKNELNSLKKQNFEEILKTNNNLNELSKQLSDTKSQFIFPIGFIYVQLPNQKTPQEMWPSMTWTEISKNYANVFFRVIGDKTEPFGKEQSESISQITRIHSQYEWEILAKQQLGSVLYDISCPNSGWTDWLETGGWVGSAGGNRRFTRFYISGKESHPQNMAIKVWKRTN